MADAPSSPAHQRLRALGALLLAVIVVVMPIGGLPAQAAAGDPWDPAQAIAFQLAGGTLYKMTTQSDGTVLYSVEGTPGPFNSLVLNPLDGYLYATSASPSNHVLKIGQGGVVVNGNVATLPADSNDANPGSTFIAGAIDPTTGAMYVGGTSSLMTSLSVVDLVTGTVTGLSLSQGIAGSADLVWQGGLLWTVTSAGELIKIDPITGAVIPVKASALPSATSCGSVRIYGAGYALGNGNLVWIDNCSGRMYQIDMSSPTYHYFSMGDGQANANNDAASSLGSPTDLVVATCGPGQGTCLAPAGSNTPLTSYPIGRDPASRYAAGQQLTYTITVRNDGPGLSSGSVTTDTLPPGTTFVSSSNPTCTATGSTIACVSGQLAPGASTSYPITVLVAAGTSGSLTNTVTVLGNEAETDTKDNTDTHTADPQPPHPTVPRLSMDKRVASVDDVNRNGLTDTGDEIHYEFVVKNSGTVSLVDVAIDDPMLVLVVCRTTTLAPGASTRCRPHATYVITQADVDVGGIRNVATATGKTPSRTPVVSLQDSTFTSTGQKSAMSLAKGIRSIIDMNGNGMVDVGDTITYEFLVKNTGTVTLRGVAIEDPKLVGAGIGVGCPSDALAAGESVTCVAEEPYVVTAADVAAGGVHNAATAKARPPGGGPGGPGGAPGGVRVDAPQALSDVPTKERCFTISTTTRRSAVCSASPASSLPSVGMPSGLPWVALLGVTFLGAGAVLAGGGSRVRRPRRRPAGSGH
ncbi:MAG: DUF11 domain-containing protein [Nocardioidaceae bacterium]|nr:DUF11 domain-containing protein [Nocardioidaceae bacterium]